MPPRIHLTTDARSALEHSRRRAELLSLSPARARVALSRRTGGRGGMRRGGGGAPAFNPRNYGTLAWWLRGDDVTLNGSDVASWNDKSGNARHWAQGTAALQPAQSVASLNGRDGVAFNLDVLNGPVLSVVGLAQCETFLVVKLAADPTGAGLDGLWHTGSGVAGNHPFTDGIIYDNFGTTVRKTTVNPVPSLASPRIYSVVTTPTEWSSYLDGALLYTTATNTVGWWAGSARLGLGVNYGNFTAWEWLVYTAKLTPTARAEVVAGLKSYYGGW